MDCKSINNKASKLRLGHLSENHLNFKNKAEEVFVTNEGYSGVITEYFGALNCTVKLSDNTVLNNILYGNIKTGSIRNPNHKSVHSVGYLGQGKYNRKRDYKAYKVWNSMFNRCYTEVYKKKYPTYEGVIVCESWHCFQNFAKWFYENYKDSFELDKDILSQHCKIYSENTCCFVPKEINCLFTKRQNERGLYPIGVSRDKNGKFRVSFTKDNRQVYFGRHKTPEEAFQIYKKIKEQHIKEVADKWKDQINPIVYQAMYNYEVEITD